MLMETYNYGCVVKDYYICFYILLLETLNYLHVIKDYLYVLYHINERNHFVNYEQY